MSQAVPDFHQLQTLLGCQFDDLELLRQAVTHSSARRSKHGGVEHAAKQSYERLEFLGDRVLGLCVARMLYKSFSEEPEGHLAKRHALLVSKPTLAQVARDLKLQRFIVVSQTERDHGGLENDGLLSDIVEALIAAMYLDQGTDIAEAFIEKQWQPLLKQNKRPPRDAKTSLQEWSQGMKKILPIYELLDHSGPSHRPTFRVKVRVDGFGQAEGVGASKREAEQQAASALIKTLKASGNMTGKSS